MRKRGIQYQEGLPLEELAKYGFTELEVPYGKKVNAPEELPAAGVSILLKEMTPFVFSEALADTAKKGAQYLVIDTRGAEKAEKLTEILNACKKQVCNAPVKIYIENSYGKKEMGQICYTDFSDGKRLSKLVQEYNNLSGKSQFGICINMGYVNILGQNIRKIIEETEAYLELMHMSDNDGVHDEHQIPFTYTKGRGALATDWYRAIGQLIKMKYDGRIVFDTNGAFERAPKQLYGAYARLLSKVADVWEQEFHFEEYLNQPQKKLILFGAGAMEQTYMEMWGEKYPPVFLVDNNEKIWGMERDGIPVKEPKAILEIPEEERMVLICNMYYDTIGKQLKQMGVAYECFWDQYYL